MATTLQVIEGRPSTRPPLDHELGPAAEVVWSRIEEWTAFRWGPRPVSFIVEGGGCWRAPLYPFTAETVEEWCGEAWQAVGLPVAPLGGWVLGGAQAYRFAGTAGAGGPLPAEVVEAARRLQAFWDASEGEDPAVTQRSRTEGDLTENVSRSRDWLGRAIHSSGAADLLRKYRRAP